MSGAINLPLALGALKGTVSALFGCVPGGKSQNARLVTGLLFFLYVFAMFGVRHWIEPLRRWLPAEDRATCDNACLAYYTTYRLGLALAGYHLFQFLLLLGVSGTDDPRSKIHAGLWPLKIFLLVGLGMGSVFIRRTCLDYFFYPAVMVGTVFLLVQAVLLVDLAYSWAEMLLDGVAEDRPMTKIILLGTTTLSGLASIAALVAFFVYFEGNLERTLLLANAALLVVTAVCSVLPNVQESNPSAGLFQCALLGLYSIFITLSALISDPQKHSTSLPIAGYPRLGKLVSVLSVVFSFLALARSAFSAGNNLHRMVPEEREAGAEIGEGDSDDGCNYSLFHLGFAMAAFYTILYLTLWQHASVVNGVTVISTSRTSFWMTWSSSWLVSLLYLWSLFAPMILEDRDF